MFLVVMLLCVIIFQLGVTAWLVASAIEREGKKTRLFMLMVSKATLSDKETKDAFPVLDRECDLLLKSIELKRAVINR